MGNSTKDLCTAITRDDEKIIDYNTVHTVACKKPEFLTDSTV